ncbi:hydantoinase B/oxoprolinase family protein [Bradyrhizobium sp. RDI18]|uniref:hydantoinase B/oxoprolinase family protein n=1 Tax=Bradyrhizobium sp. RDI18 TaxID=3367400 RepID=UPI003712CCA3
MTAGAINELLIEIIKNNVRIPEQVLGDLWEGKARGGDGQVFEIDLLADEPVTMSFMADRLRTPAPGMHGGEPGATGHVLLDGVPIDPRETVVAAPRSRLTLETPGGGGFALFAATGSR